jgi:hypothetical protein
MQSESTFSDQHYTDPHSARLGKLSNFACCFGALKSGILQIWKKFQILENLRSMTLFSDPRNSTSKCFKLACKVNWYFRLGDTQILTAPGRQKSIHFACWFGALKSGILQIRKKCQIPKDLRIMTLFQILKIRLISAPNRHAKWIDLFRPGTFTQILTPLSQKKSFHFACQFGALISGIFRIWKKYHNPEILRNLALFSEFQNSTSKCS